MTPPTLQQTRRQLDDLDGLIQRMLAMPLTHLDELEAEIPEATRWAPEEFAPLPFPNRLLAEARITPTDPMEPAEPSASTVRSWRVEFGPRNRELSIPLPGEAERALPFASVVVEDVPRPFLPEPSKPQPAPNPPEVHSALVRPFVRLNRSFDGLVRWTPFFLLARPTGKMLLGWLGIAMVLGALGWAYLDWTEFRWTEPPLPPNMK